MVKTLQDEGYMVNDMYLEYVLTANLIQVKKKKGQPVWDKDAVARLKGWLVKMGRGPKKEKQDA